MKKTCKPIVAVLCAGVVAGAGAAYAGPLDGPGAQKALICSACHGFGGNPPSKTVPPLAGMDQIRFKTAINAFAEGKRQSPEMEPYSKYVLEFGLDEIADYFAAQKRAAPSKPSAIPAKAAPR